MTASNNGVTAPRLTLEDTFAAILDAQQQQLSLLEDIKGLLQTSRASYFEIDSNSRAGETKLHIKRVGDSPVPIQEGVAEYTEAILAAANADVLKGWQETVDQLQQRQSAAGRTTMPSLDDLRDFDETKV